MNRINLPDIEFDLVNLCCGKQEYGLGIDMLDAGQAIVWDLRKGIPLPDKSVKAFHTSHFFEHLNRDDLYPLFNEIIRVAKHGAELYIIVPHSETDESDFLGHLCYWDEKRVRGIVNGLHGAIEIISMKRRGIELHAKLKIL